MPDNSPRLLLPYILPSQAQKHVTHNEALQVLDVLVQPVVINRNLTAPPAAPTEGDCHLIAAGATGLWAGRTGQIAAYLQNGWVFVVPKPGWRVHVLAEGQTLTRGTSSWTEPASQLLQVAAIGVNTAADPVNRLSVTAASSLLNHTGAGHQLKINKATDTDTASLLFQTGFSGRAEMGTAGNDDFSIKVSAAGTTFTEALRINRTTGIPTAPQGMVITGALTGSAVTQSATDTTAGRVLLAQHGYSRGNVIGTVSQTSNIPTGAVLERGSNANGSFIRMADGTQICWSDGALAIASRAAGSFTSASWAFPASFVSGALPLVQVSARSFNDAAGIENAARYLSASASPQSNNSSLIGIHNRHTAAVSGRIDAFAIGRWY